MSPLNVGQGAVLRNLGRTGTLSGTWICATAPWTRLLGRSPGHPAFSWFPGPQERVLHEEHLRQVEAQLDYLAPFLAQLPPGEKLTRWQAVRLKDECLSDFKQRLIDKANLIQARFEKVWPGPKAGEVTSLSSARKWILKSLLGASQICG